MNKLSRDKRKQIIAALVEGNSIRATCRMTDTAKGTVLKLLADIGEVCAEYQYEHLRNLSCVTVQCDEIWAFCYGKEKNVPIDLEGAYGYGDVWTWTAICADSKLVPAWYIGGRDGEDAKAFMLDLASHMKNRLQITTDGHAPYLSAIEEAFGNEVNYSQLVKMYGASQENEKRYSPAHCIGIRKHRISGTPNKDKVSTSYVERQNLTMRMSMRRFTRLTNAFSKKVENLAHAIALHYMYYNFCRIHQSLRVTPAMAAGVTPRLWDIADLVKLLEDKEISN